MRDGECSMPRLLWLPVCEFNVAETSAESSGQGDVLLSTDVVTHGKPVSLGRAGDLHIPRSRGQCQEGMATAVMIGFVTEKFHRNNLALV